MSNSSTPWLKLSVIELMTMVAILVSFWSSSKERSHSLIILPFLIVSEGVDIDEIVSGRATDDRIGSG